MIHKKYHLRNLTQSKHHQTSNDQNQSQNIRIHSASPIDQISIELKREKYKNQTQSKLISSLKQENSNLTHKLEAIQDEKFDLTLEMLSWKHQFADLTFLYHKLLGGEQNLAQRINSPNKHDLYIIHEEEEDEVSLKEIKDSLPIENHKELEKSQMIFQKVQPLQQNMRSTKFQLYSDPFKQEKRKTQFELMKDKGKRLRCLNLIKPKQKKYALLFCQNGYKYQTTSQLFEKKMQTISQIRSKRQYTELLENILKKTFRKIEEYIKMTCTSNVLPISNSDLKKLMSWLVMKKEQLEAEKLCTLHNMIKKIFRIESLDLDTDLIFELYKVLMVKLAELKKKI